MKISELGYIRKKKKLAISCDCGKTFLHVLRHKVITCPACGLTSHRKFVYEKQDIGAGPRVAN
jgi:DNA-directed RNA polymerase subunit RPC12/RpoP